jgi:hypothetical protein
VRRVYGTRAARAAVAGLLVGPLLGLLVFGAGGGCARQPAAPKDPRQGEARAHGLVALAAVEALPPATPTVAHLPPRLALGPVGSYLRPKEQCDGASERHVTFAHVNDMQARYGEKIAGKSRYAYVAGYLRQLKEEVPDTLVLDAGDDYEKGSLLELRSMGEATRQMVQALPIDVRTMGNHDFAFGEAAVERDVTLSLHPVLAANVHRHGESGPFAPYARFDVGCVRVGVVGLVTQNYAADDTQTKEAYDGVFEQDDHYVDILTEQVRLHRAEVDVFVALTHLGLFADVELARRVFGVDLVIGGHSEDLVKTPYVLARADGSHAFVLQAGHYARNIGRADLVVAPKDKGVNVAIERYRVINVDESLPAVDDVADLASRLEHEIEPDASQVIAHVKAPIAAGRPMADLVWHAVAERWGADGMILGRDLFWDGLPAGPVTLQRLYDTVLVQRQPAGTSGFSSLHVIAINGAELATLAGKLGGGAYVSVHLPDAIEPKRTYRVAIEKRALTFPRVAFAAPVRLPRGRYAGELIDVLEAYARARTAAGLPLE